MIKIEMSNISVKFGEFYAVHDINLKVDDGEYITVLGPSGCGKTTLIKVISGIWTPNNGKVYIDGVDVTMTPIEDRDVGYMFQNIALFPHMNLRDNISYGPRVKDYKKDEIHRLSTEYLRLVDMFSRAGMFPDELSGGEQQKVSIARALASGSKILLLDEPLSALDAHVRLELRYELRHIVKDLGITVIHVTHDQEEAMSVSDRIVLMRNGHIIDIGTPMEMYRHPKSVFAANFIGETNLIECTVTKKFESGEAKILLKGGLEIIIPKANFGVGCWAVLSIRPEYVYPSNDGLKIRVTGVVFMGIYWRIHTVAESGYHLEYNISQKCDPPNVGDEGYITFNKDEVIILANPRSGIDNEINLG